MARKSNAQKEAEEVARRAALTPEELAAEDKAKVGDALGGGDTGAGPVNTTTQVPPKKEDEMVQIKRTDFDLMMQQMEKQAKDIDLLYRTTDKGKLAKEMNKEGENLIKQCKVRIWGDSGLMVVGWSDMKTQRCEVIMGRWYEEQTVNLVLEGGEVVTVPYLEFVRKSINKVEADIVSRNEEYDDNRKKVIMFKLQFPSGKTLLINSAFVN